MIMKMMIIVTFVVMSISTTVGQSIDNLAAPVSSPNLEQLSSNNPTMVRPQSFFTDCLKATVDKSDECVTDIYYSIVHHDFKFASACCQTVFDVGAECIQERLGLVGYLLPRVLRKACGPIFKPTSASTTNTLGLTGRDNTITSSTTTAVGKSTSNFAINGPVEEFQKCLSSVRSVERCVEEVVTSFLSLQYRFIGPACCKAITKINDACWPKLVPFNPFFPPLLKNYCVSLLIPNFPPPPVVTNALSIGPN